MSYSEWLELTPAELDILAESWLEAREDRMETLQHGIYTLAALIRPMIWGEDIPSYEDVFGGAGHGGEDMTDEAMYEVVLAWNKALGGVEA